MCIRDRYYGEGETILIRQYPNGQYYVQYCYDDQDDTVYATAGGFDTFVQDVYKRQTIFFTAHISPERGTHKLTC